MTKVYTKTGDKGTTSLVGGERVSKIAERVEAYGTVDELGSFTAYLSDHLRSDEGLAEYLGDLDRVASQLMSVAALLAVGHGGEGKLPDISPEAIGYLEERIDAMQSRVRPITKFTIPGGHPTVSLCHVCRTVCRRAERASLRAAALHPTISANTLAYLVSFAFNYIASTRFTFRVKATTKRGMGFALSHLVNYTMQTLLLQVFLFVGMPKQWALIPVFCVCVPVNFLLVRFFLRK